MKYLGREVLESIEFKVEGTFHSYYAAQHWCKENGFDYGSTCAMHPMALMRGKYIAYGIPQKWKNMSDEERNTVHGIMTGDLRDGTVKIFIFNKTASRKDRVLLVNLMIHEIASRGRRFFTHEDKIAEIIDTGRIIYYKAEFGKKELLCLTIPGYRKPKGWFHGGTLLALVKEFRDFIRTGNSIEYSQLHSSHWGYPEDDMKYLLDLALQLGLIKNKTIQ